MSVVSVSRLYQCFFKGWITACMVYVLKLIIVWVWFDLFFQIESSRFTTVLEQAIEALVKNITTGTMKVRV